MDTILYLCIGVAGFLLGCLITRYALTMKTVGTLRIDNSDLEGPYLFLELKHGIPSGVKYVTLAVKEKNYISRD